MTIDYTKLNDRIVEQAYDVSTAFLNKKQVQKLFQNKIDRAQEMLRGRDVVKPLTVYHTIED